MTSFNFIVSDLVKNPEGELLAVTRHHTGYLRYIRTIKDGAELAEERREYYFKRKSDIKKIRPSKEKEAMIDRLNLWILRCNMDFMGAALEKADEQLYTFAERNGIDTQGDRWFENFPESMQPLAEAAKLLARGSYAYRNVLGLIYEHGIGVYNIQLDRIPARWQIIKDNRGKGA